MADPAPLDVRIDDLLAHGSWVRRLARGLVGPDQADDLAQDVWLRALRSPPAGGERGSLRGWLRQVLVNRARELRRGAARSEAREQLVARPVAIDDPLERLALHRELVERVAELAEPWRRTILLRYFEGLELSEIAARDDVPLSTVNTRLVKGRELLRLALDARHGGKREAWSALLLPFALERAPLAPASAAGLPTAVLTGLAAPFLAMKIPLVLTGVAAAALTTFLVLRGGKPDPVVRPQASPALAAAPAAVEPDALAPAAAGEPGRGEMRVEPETPPSSAPAAAAVASPEEPPSRLVGWVIDFEGSPMSGLAVWLANPGEDRQLATSAKDGSFTVDPETDHGPIEVRDAHWGTVLGCRLERGTRSGPTLVVAPWITVGGLVRAEDGSPIERAELIVMQPVQLRSRVLDVLDDAMFHEPVVRTDAEGRFALDRTLAVEGTRMRVEAHGYEQVEIPLPAVSTQALEIVLRRPQASPNAVLGQVVDARGLGVAGAWVSLGYTAVRTDDGGGFQIDVGNEGKFDRLIAVQEGHLPAILEHPLDASGEKVPWPRFVLLQLGGEPLGLAGRVVDTTGRALVGWKVWLADPTYFSHVDQRGVVTEGLLQGLLDVRGGEDEQPSAAWPWARTDANGRFELFGLLDRDYKVDVYDAPHVLLARAGPFQAGRRDVEIVLDLEKLSGPVSGRVVDPEGVGLAGVSVETSTNSYIMPHGLYGTYSWGDPGPTTTTDEEGRFRFSRLPMQRVWINVHHPDVMPETVQVGPGPDGEPSATPDPSDITIVCERRYHLKIETDDPSAASAHVEVLDEKGEMVLIHVFSANGSMSTTSYPLVEGQSETLALPGSAHEIVLKDDEGHELARRKLELVFGDVNLLRL